MPGIMGVFVAVEIGVQYILGMALALGVQTLILFLLLLALYALVNISLLAIRSIHNHRSSFLAFALAGSVFPSFRPYCSHRPHAPPSF